MRPQDASIRAIFIRVQSQSFQSFRLACGASKGFCDNLSAIVKMSDGPLHAFVLEIDFNQFVIEYQSTQ
jgi:hypothetical protein